MKRALVLLGCLCVGAAYLLGYWPQHERLVVLEQEAGALRTQLDDAQSRVRLGGVLGRLLELTDAVSERNFGHAQGLSSRFFDQVRAEAARLSDPRQKSLLEGVLQKRDTVTAGLTRSDPATLELLRTMQVEFRVGLGYTQPPAPGASPATAASPTPSAEISKPAPTPAATPIPHGPAPS